jgi:FAD/FMN-containing dehydrogenase
MSVANEVRIDVEALRRKVAGEVLTPAETGYNAATQIWNRSIQRRPAVIVRVASAADAQAALAFGLERGLPISIRGGGHNVAGSALADHGLVIDHSGRRAVRVDPTTRIVEVDPGVTLGELDLATAPHGLAVPIGINTTTGVAGLTLGGGIGWLMREHGLSCDHLVGADVLLADGSIVRASEDENADLLWALRGGGGNVGIVTKFVFRAVPQDPEVLAGLALFSMDEGEAVIRRYRDWAADLPDSVSTIVALRTVLPIPAFPSELHGRRVIGIVVCDATGEGAEAVAAIPSFGTQLLSSIKRKPFVAHQASFDPTVPPGLDYYWKSHFLAGLPDDAIDVIVDHHRRTPTTWSYSLIPQLGGAISRIPEAATAYANRAAPYAININGVGTEPGEHDRTVPWVREVFEALKPFSTGGVYVNFLGDEGEDRVRAAYGSAYDRLAAIKAKYDPTNVFRTNQNVPPARPS